jgi:cytochrome c oxidase subunit 2
MTLPIGITRHLAPLQVRGLIPRGTRVDVFRSIFDVFLILGTLVGVVVVAYMLVNAYKYRERGEESAGKGKADRPVLGELPTGGGGGRKLFLSFGISAVIVVSLIGWTYGTLLFVENNPVAVDGENEGDEMEVTVEGYQFGWEFRYANGHVVQNTLRVPVDTEIAIRVTSRDVFHNFGIPELRVKSDAIPGEETRTWFAADETGTYTARCYELCGSGHSHMVAEVIVMPKDEFRQWYANQSSSEATVDRPAPAPAVADARAHPTGVTGA